MKKKHFYYYKDWFVFPFSLTVHTRLMEYVKPTSSVELHFLWWHWRWIITKKDGE